MDYTELYKKAYACLENRTPVLFDCGELCRASCCTNNGKGMLLFPREEEYIRNMTDDFTIVNSGIVVSGYRVKLLTCSGSCDRHTRPLACRIFPLFPFFTNDGRISVDFDPRAKGTCPLLLTDVEGIYIGGLFRLSVFQAAEILKEDPLIRAFMIQISNELETIRSFRL